MFTSNDKLKKGSGAGGARRRLSNSARAADLSFTLPGEVPDDESIPAAVRQSTILSTSAHGLVSGSGVRDSQRRLKISTPAAGHISFALPGAVEEEEWSPEAHGLVTGSGVSDARRRSNISTPAARHLRFTLPGAVEEEEERGQEAVRQGTILSTSAHGLVTGSGVRGVWRRSKISTPAASQESIAPPRVADAKERRKAEKQTKRRKVKGIRAFFQRKLQALQRFCCICSNDDDLEPSDPDDPQPGPSGLQSSSREDDRQNSPTGLEPAGCHKPGCCPPGLNTLEKTDLQEETDLENGPLDQEPSAQRDQTDSQPGPSGLQSRAREYNRQNGPSGLKPAGCHKSGCCPPGLNTLEKTYLQEETDLENGPFDQEPSAQRDQTGSQPGPSGLQSRAREYRQNSPSGLKPAGCHKSGCCPPGLNTLEKTDLQEETDLENGPLDQEPSAQRDQTDSQPGPSGLQSRAREYNRQNGPSGLKPAGCHKSGCCPPGLNTLEKTDLQEETDLENGPFDQEPSAQRDQTDSQPGPSGLQSRAREYRQNSPSGLKPAGCHKSGCCPPGSSKLKRTAHQDPADPEHGPSDQEPRAQSDQVDPQSGPSGLQSSGHQRSHPARRFKLLYEVGEQIGRGGFGVVYEGIRKSDGRKVAIKIAHNTFMDQYIEIPGYAKPLLLEVAINLLLLKPEKSPHIVEMLDWFEEDQHILVLEFPHPCVTLAKLMADNDGCLSEPLARQLMHQAVLGAKHCIDHGIYHGDMKIDNALVNTETMEFKLIDFGLGDLVENCGIQSDGYIRKDFAVAQTVYFLGILLYKMLHGDDLTKSYYRIDKKNLSSNISRECRDFIFSCLAPAGVRKPTLEELLNHEWFK